MKNLNDDVIDYGNNNVTVEIFGYGGQSRR